MRRALDSYSLSHQQFGGLCFLLGKMGLSAVSPRVPRGLEELLCRKALCKLESSMRMSHLEEITMLIALDLPITWRVTIFEKRTA